ncbi:MAG: hypothetical protein AAGA54_35890 [Myxococcota bacterium]
MRTPIATVLFAALSLSTVACDGADKAASADKGAKKADAKKDAKADAKKDDAKAEAKPEAKAEPAAEKPADKPAEKPAPTLEALAIADWGVTLQVPAGTKLGEVTPGDGMADEATIDAESTCGAEIELYRHKKTKNGVAEMFKNATGPSGNKNDQFPVKEQTETGYKVQHSWDPPLGTVYASEVGMVLGDHLILCGAGGMMGVEKEQAECVFKACETLALAAG